MLPMYDTTILPEEKTMTIFLGYLFARMIESSGQVGDVCMYVCYVYLCAHMYMLVFVFIKVCVSVYIYMYICISMSTNLYTLIYLDRLTYKLCIS